MPKPQVNKDSKGGSPLAASLRALQGTESTLDYEGLDSRLLYAATVALAQRSASITIGTTLAGDSWVVQVWDGKYPIKDYYRSTEALNKHLAALCRVLYGREVSSEMEGLIREYGY